MRQKEEDGYMSVSDEIQDDKHSSLRPPVPQLTADMSDEEILNVLSIYFKALNLKRNDLVEFYFYE